MKSLLIALLALTAGAAIFLIFFSSNDLSSKIESLKLARESLLCERETPTAISLNYFADEKNGWRALFAGKNHKDFILRFAQFSKNTSGWEVIVFFFIDGVWQDAQTVTPEEVSKFRKTSVYSEEEDAFIGSCAEKLFKYLEANEAKKRLYTPVAFFYQADGFENYPAEIRELMDGLEPAVCELERPRKVGAKLYRREDEDWFIRIFTNNSEELEIWINYDDTKFFAFYVPDKIFYKIDNKWLEKNSVSKEISEELDKRLKFTIKELKFLGSCFKKKFK